VIVLRHGTASLDAGEGIVEISDEEVTSVVFSLVRSLAQLQVKRRLPT
jgi:hypothetical protein